MFFLRLFHASAHLKPAAQRLTRMTKSAKQKGRTRANLDQTAARALAGVAGREDADLPDVRHGVLFKIFNCPDNDETALDPNHVGGAAMLADRAREYYKLRADLFPPDDIFYEEVEAAHIERVARIDNEGAKGRFMATLDRARRLSNDNTRKLLCSLAPGALIAALALYGVFLLLTGALIWPDSPVSAEAARLLSGTAALGLSAGAVGFIYLFSYSHIQRANALSLNAFIATEFAHLNNTFLVAQREALQAETQLADTQKDEIKRGASSWTLAYHWISVRQFFEEMFVRNTMFQIRRNTTLYGALGVGICLSALTVLALLTWVGASFIPGSAPVPGWIDVLHMGALTAGFIAVSYGLLMRRPFAIVASALLKDQWYRYDTMSVGGAVAEQVTRDKVQIVINRDRARAAGV
jgi:hypothetical protein